MMISCLPKIREKKKTKTATDEKEKLNDVKE